MTQVRKIDPEDERCRHYYLVDANFLANKHIPASRISNSVDRDRVVACQEWWHQIDAQLASDHARVYVPDICIAEAFKVLAKKYYSERVFASARSYHYAKSKLSKDIRTNSRDLQSHARKVKYHDISTNRDIVIGVDRFFETFMKHGHKVQIGDLIFAATAKYLMDFYDIAKDYLHIVTLDRPLRRGIAKMNFLPRAYDPTERAHRAHRIFDCD